MVTLLHLRIGKPKPAKAAANGGIRPCYCLKNLALYLLRVALNNPFVKTWSLYKKIKWYAVHPQNHDYAAVRYLCHKSRVFGKK